MDPAKDFAPMMTVPSRLHRGHASSSFTCPPWLVSVSSIHRTSVVYYASNFGRPRIAVSARPQRPRSRTFFNFRLKADATCWSGALDASAMPLPPPKHRLAVRATRRLAC